MKTRKQRAQKEKENKGRRKRVESAVQAGTLSPFQRFTALETRGYKTFSDALGNPYIVFKIADSVIPLHPSYPEKFIESADLDERKHLNLAEFTDPYDGVKRYLIEERENILTGDEYKQKEARKEETPEWVNDAKPKTRSYKYATTSQTFEYIKGKPKEIPLISIDSQKFVVLDIDEKLPPGVRIKGAIAKVKTSRGTQYIIPRDVYIEQGFSEGSIYEQIASERGSYDIRTREKRYFDKDTGEQLPFRNNARVMTPLGEGKKGKSNSKVFAVLGRVFKNGGGKVRSNKK